MSYARLILIAVLTISLSGIGVDLYTPSMPAIAQDFMTRVALVKMTIPMYLIGFAIGQLFFGTLSDVYGRKGMLQVGLIIFILVSCFAPFTKNIHVLMLIRSIQGFGAASASVISKAMLADKLQGKKKLAVAASYLTIAWACCTIIAPVIGGYLQDYFHWQANFYFYSIYTFLIFVVIWLYFQETIAIKTTAHPYSLFTSIKEIVSHRVFLGGSLSLGFGYSIIIIFNVAGPFLIQDSDSHQLNGNSIAAQY